MRHAKSGRHLRPGRRRGAGRRRLRRRRAAEAAALADRKHPVNPRETKAVQPQADFHRHGTEGRPDTDPAFDNRAGTNANQDSRTSADQHGSADTDQHAAHPGTIADGPGGGREVHARQ
ncbi:hypothetical protein [Streptomyces sp. NPDC017993]|uniref:hypothetical protein n=1 Tax=Streptomyces sp. NPDC017993 TaxID=3365027 RepID=UPI00379CF802